MGGAVRGGGTTGGAEGGGGRGEEGGKGVVVMAGTVVEVVAMGTGEMIVVWREVMPGEVVCGAQRGRPRRKMGAIGETGGAGGGGGDGAGGAREGEVTGSL